MFLLLQKMEAPGNKNFRMLIFFAVLRVREVGPEAVSFLAHCEDLRQ